MPELDEPARLALAGLSGATLAAEVFTVDFPDRKHISGGYVFPLIASSVINPLAGVIAAGSAGLVAGALRGQRLRSALFHGPQLAIAAALAAWVELLVFGRIPFEPSMRGALAVLLYAGVFTCTAWLLGRAEEAIAAKPASHASVELLTNLLLVPLPLLLAFIYQRTSLTGLLFSALALALLLVVVRAYVNLATLHGELKGAYARLANQEQQLESALETNREMSQIMSHDLRGPLTSVMGYAELLRSSLSSPEANVEKQRRYVESIENNSRRIQSLADKLLDLHRLEEGGEFELVRVEPSAFARQLADEMTIRAEQNKLTLNIDLAPGLPALQTSEWMLHEIAENLISNAIKYTKEGGRVDVGLRPDAGQLLLEVEDNGLGMSAEDQARLFTKFFRSASKEVRGLRGTGLGLALTRAMIERLGGRVEVWSELGKGSRFSVHLPLSVAEGP
ncbi:MAG TPA: HAMP domain-containing sensor histidine kinase [Chloroflexota bacterium]|nr:HAMP domain-containing sensor histidine kinase [Chloroflexota bacterium]